MSLGRRYVFGSGWVLELGEGVAVGCGGVVEVVVRCPLQPDARTTRWPVAWTAATTRSRSLVGSEMTMEPKPM